MRDKYDSGDETLELEELPIESKKKPDEKEPVNIMGDEPEPKQKVKATKKEPFNALDLSPVMKEIEKLDQKLAALVEGKKPAPAPEPEQNLIEQLGDW